MAAEYRRTPAPSPTQLEQQEHAATMAAEAAGYAVQRVEVPADIADQFGGEPTRVIIYIHDAESNTLAWQESLCRDYCARNGYTVIAVIVDQAGGLDWENRTGAQELMRRITGKEAELVVVYRWSRISRHPAILTQAVAAIEATGVTVESVTEPTTTKPTDNTLGRIFLDMAAALDHEDDDGAARG